MLPMTRHKALHTGLVSPSPLDRWINALLHAFAMLVSNVARRLAPKYQTPTAECDGDQASALEASPVLDQHRETKSVAASSCAQHASSSSVTHAIAPESAIAREGLMVRRSRSDRLSNPSGSEGRVARGGLAALSTSHSRLCAENPGSSNRGTLSNLHDATMEILRMRFAYPRMTRCWVCMETLWSNALL
jgi:hypothetical protein